MFRRVCRFTCIHTSVLQRENLYVCRIEYTYEVDIREYSRQSTYCNVPGCISWLTYTYKVTLLSFLSFLNVCAQIYT